MPNPVSPVVKACETCRKSFETGGRGRPPRSRRWCSAECFARSRTIDRPQRTCPVCGTVFQITGTGRRRRGRVYCTRRCAGLARQKPSHIPTMPLTDAAYLAGLIDGEGSIVITGRTYKSLRVMVTNTSIPALDWLAEHVGGSRSLKKPNGSFVSRLPCWTWAVNGLSAADVLEQVLPYLVIKRDRAIAALVENGTKK